MAGERELSLAPELLADAFGRLATGQDVAALLDISYRDLIYYLYRYPFSKYSTFTLNKKSGGQRVIQVPATGLKILQQKLNTVLQTVYWAPPSVFGFVPEHSTAENAQVHEGSRFVARVDLADFFDTVNFGRVRGVFMARPYSIPAGAATVLAQICCHENRLPQGAPTSPVVSNMVCRRLDRELQRLARRHRCRYTRYADDLTFSTQSTVFPSALVHVVTESGAQQAVAGDALQRVVTSNGFQIHEKKTSLRGFWQRQLVTGLVVNERANVPRRFVRQIRGMLHAWKAFGEEAAQAEFELRYKRQRAPFFPMPRFRDVLRGKIEFVGMVRGFRDPVYLSFHTLYCELADVKFVQKNRLDHLVHLEDAIWIVEGDKYQGTAFFLTGVGLVTCAHVLEGASVVFDSRSPSNKFPVRVIKSDIKRDVAVLEFPHAPRRLLRKGSSVLPKSGTPVTVCGFPEWAPGVSMWTSRGEVAAVRAPFGQPRVYTTGVISAGASGAPVFDLNRNVIGIAAIGAQRLDETIERGPHAFIPLQQLLDVLDT